MVVVVQILELCRVDSRPEVTCVSRRILGRQQHRLYKPRFRAELCQECQRVVHDGVRRGVGNVVIGIRAADASVYADIRHERQQGRRVLNLLDSVHVDKTERQRESARESAVAAVERDLHRRLPLRPVVDEAVRIDHRAVRHERYRGKRIGRIPDRHLRLTGHRHGVLLRAQIRRITGVVH